MSAEDIAGVQRGMAERPDSVATLATINVPTLLVAGDEDSIPLSEFELMRHHISGSRLQVIPQAGHYAALEKPTEVRRPAAHVLQRTSPTLIPKLVPVVTLVTLPLSALR